MLFWKTLSRHIVFWGQEQCFLGKKITIAWCILHIILNQICKFAITQKNDAFVANFFMAIFALAERLPTCATLLPCQMGTLSTCHWIWIWNCLKLAPAIHFDFYLELVLGYPIHCLKNCVIKDACFCQSEVSGPFMDIWTGAMNYILNSQSTKNWIQSTRTLSNPNHRLKDVFKRARAGLLRWDQVKKAPRKWPFPKLSFCHQWSSLD